MLLYKMNFIIHILDHHFKHLLLLVGFILTLWRSYECLVKYYSYNLSTKISMKQSFETIRPAIVLCPQYGDSYNLRLVHRWKIGTLLIKCHYRQLNKYNIKTQSEYRNGKWIGNSSTSARDIYYSVTYNLTDLLESISFLYEYDSNWTRYGNNNLTYREIRYKTYGRCFEILTGLKDEDLYKVDLVFYRTLNVYVIQPNTLLFRYSKSKFQANLGEKLYLEGKERYDPIY